MTLEQKYPKLFETIEDKDIELRHLISIDENYEDFDSEEFEFDFEDYNFVVYITELVQNALGNEKLAEYIAKLEAHPSLENFLASEDDLYGIKTTLSEDEIVELFLGLVEEVL